MVQRGAGVKVPARISCAVELLDVRGDDQILEFGCGPGVAAALVAHRLESGHLTALDRSLVAIERARARNEAQVRAGRASFHHAELAAFEGEPATVDKAFAVNVNLFWTTDAAPECLVLSRLLAPAGRLWLVYDGPGDRAATVAATATGALHQQGWDAEVLTGASEALAAVAARPPAP